MTRYYFRMEYQKRQNVSVCHLLGAGTGDFDSWFIEENPRPEQSLDEAPSRFEVNLNSAGEQAPARQ